METTTTTTVTTQSAGPFFALAAMGAVQSTGAINPTPTPTPVAMSDAQYRCALCNKPHPLYRCSLYKALSPKQRCVSAQAHGYCLNCLARSHTIRTCNSEMRCRICGSPHHTSLHVAGTPHVRPHARAPLPRGTTHNQAPGRGRRGGRGTRHSSRSTPYAAATAGRHRGTTRNHAVRPPGSSGTTHTHAATEDPGHRGREAFRLLGEAIWLMARQP